MIVGEKLSWTTRSSCEATGKLTAGQPPALGAVTSHKALLMASEMADVSSGLNIRLPEQGDFAKRNSSAAVIACPGWPGSNSIKENGPK